jgi:ABC-2 type transport system ATP-binding protein
MTITFENVSKKYVGKYALKGFCAELHEGVYGLLGANGAGKTTLINIFVGILKPNGGEIYMDGTNIRNMGREFLSQIGYMPQYPVFYKDFEVLEFLEYMSAMKGMGPADGKRRATELMEICNLADAAHKKIGALSGGMRQRVGIVQAMLNNPAILILDEPTAGLDPHERIRFRNLISRFAGGRTVLLATHIVSDVECIANEVLILKEGELIRKNAPSALEREIDGKVWLAEADEQEFLNRFAGFHISNMQREGEKLILRILSDTPPTPSAVQVLPNLEDVFLFHFGGGERP